MDTDIDISIKIRTSFPSNGQTHLGGLSDGMVYRTVFGGPKLEHTYQLVKLFLEEEGFGDIPLPKSAAELELFRNPQPHQSKTLFGEYGYQHFPVKIMFHPFPDKKYELILYLYNENIEDNLLRFYDKL